MAKFEYTDALENNRVNEFEKTLLIKRKMFFIVKRFFDIIFSIIGMVFMIPVTVIVKFFYLVSGDIHPIFYTQKRIGKNGKYIYIHKFRTMIHNADEVLNELLKDPKYKKEWKNNQKLDKDPRITRVGKLLRKTSLDELPQFINVFVGDMSLIGPRPLVEGELDNHGGNHELYESIKPGITGWWAANGRSSKDYKTRLDLEYYYIRNCSIKLDIKCFFRTISAIIKRDGAK